MTKIVDTWYQWLSVDISLILTNPENQQCLQRYIKHSGSKHSLLRCYIFHQSSQLVIKPLLTRNTRQVAASDFDIVMDTWNELGMNY